jgi:hypothetical protein
MSRDVFPAIAVKFMKLEKLKLLLSPPRLFVHCRIEMIVPSLPALFARTFSNRVIFLEFLRNFSPIIKAMLSDKLTDRLILLNG